MNEKLERFLRRVENLPSIPAVASQAMKVAADPESSAEDLRRVLDGDPALAARILKVANSARFAFARKVETLQHAVALLGFRAVENLVLAASLKDVFQHFGLTEKLLWEHATLAGLVASRLASYGPVDVDRESAFTAGLLHDLGKIALDNASPRKYQEVVKRVYNEEVDFVQAEREAFGFDHAELGARIAERWQLPEALVRAIRHHHDEPEAYAELPEADRRLVALTTVTTRCCTRLGAGRRGPVDSVDPGGAGAWSLLGLSPEDVEPVLELASEQAKAGEGLLD